MRAFIPVLLGLALASCAGAPKQPLVIRTVPLEDSQCQASIKGEVVENEQVTERFTALKRDHHAAVVVGTENTQYRCLGWIIFSLQRAGFRKISFQTEAGS